MSAPPSDTHARLNDKLPRQAHRRHRTDDYLSLFIRGCW